MKRVLALYYSQTGQLRSALDSFLSGLDPREFQVEFAELRPRAAYPFPWSFFRFLDVFPESVLGIAPEIEPPGFDPEAHYDLIVLGYTVWYLAPSLPVQGFLRSPHARVLAGKPVITLVACRNMWHTASVRMKRELARLGAEHCDNVAVTDSGPAWTTFVTTPRWMLTGRRDRSPARFGGTKVKESETKSPATGASDNTCRAFAMSRRRTNSRIGTRAKP